MNKNSFGTGIVAVVIFIAVLGLIGMALEESEPKCIKSGCDNEQASGSSYCYMHKPSSYSGGSTGTTSGYQSGNSSSSSNVASGSTSNTCHHGSCKKEIIRGSRYCASHTCDQGRGGCYQEVWGANELCSRCREKNQSSNSTSSNRSKSYGSSSYSSNKKSSSTKKYRMPDCDDYESYDDFMDDWDGNMPDDSDAEDYWEDW